MKLEIRTLTTTDLDSADQILNDAFGTTDSRKLDLEFYLGLQPDGRFLALADDTPVGIVGAVDYGPFAYVGTMGVLHAWQGHGIGRKLMEHLLTWLDARNSPVAILDATDAGARLYSKLGFVCDEKTQMWEMRTLERAGTSELAGTLERPRTSELARTPGHARTPEPAPAPCLVRPARDTDLTALARFDTPIFGADRSAVLREYLSQLRDRVFVTESPDGGIAGYVAAKARALGPWAARRPEDAEALLAAALSLTFERPPRVLVPSTNTDAAQLLERYGFQPGAAQHLHMRRGGRRTPGERAVLYALASFAIG